METVEDRNASGEVLLRLHPNHSSIVVEEQKRGGVISHREIDPMEFYYIVNSSYQCNEHRGSGILPEGCLWVSLAENEKWYVFRNVELRADMTYNGTEYLNFPLPRLVFGVRVLNNGKVVDCSIGVVADEMLTEDTPMYYYPFSNLYENGRVCTGNNVLPRYRKTSLLKNFPRYLLELPDNDDMFHSNHNALRLGHRELMEHLKDKTPEYYYTNILLPNGKTLGSFCEGGF